MNILRSKIIQTIEQNKKGLLLSEIIEALLDVTKRYVKE